MSRSLNTHLDTATSAVTTEPWHLVELGDLRLTDGPATTWDSQAWTSIGLNIQGQDADGSGTLAGTLSIANHDGAVTGLVLAGGADDVPVRIWQVYGDGPHALTDAALLVDGVADDVVLQGPSAQVRYVSVSADARQLPRVRIAAPLFRNLPPDGTVLEWAGDRITVEGGQ